MVKLTLTLHQTTKMKKQWAKVALVDLLNSFRNSNGTFAHLRNGKGHYVANSLFALILASKQAASGTRLANNPFPKASETRVRVGGKDHGFPSHLRSPGAPLTSLLQEGTSPSTVLLDPELSVHEGVRWAPCPTSNSQRREGLSDTMRPAARCLRLGPGGPTGRRGSRCRFGDREPPERSKEGRGRAHQGLARGTARERAPDGTRAPGDAGAARPESRQLAPEGLWPRRSDRGWRAADKDREPREGGSPRPRHGERAAAAGADKVAPSGAGIQLSLLDLAPEARGCK